MTHVHRSKWNWENVIEMDLAFGLAFQVPKSKVFLYSLCGLSFPKSSVYRETIGLHAIELIEI